jgi:hypothetical protein
MQGTLAPNFDFRNALLLVAIQFVLYFVSGERPSDGRGMMTRPKPTLTRLANGAATMADHLRGALRRELIPSAEERPRQRVSFEGTQLWHLPEAGRFKKDAELTALPLIREFRQQLASQLLNELITGSDDEFADWDSPKRGRPPLEGDWAALYLAYVASKCVVVEDFHRNLQKGKLLHPLAEACGFTDIPSRQAIDAHFVELEKHADAFIEVARELIRRAKREDPRIGEVVFLDSTRWSSAAALEHACEDLDACFAHGGKKMARARKALAPEIDELHQRDGGAVEPDIDLYAASIDGTRGPIVTRMSQRGALKYRSFFIKAHGLPHRWLSRDLSSGVRYYEDERVFWLGGYAQAARDMYTGLDLAVSVFPNDVCEWDGYPETYKQMVAALGERPRVVSVDRGFVNRPFYEYNARRGVAVVGPFRERKPKEKLEDRRTDAVDEHGVPRCAYCGGPGDRISPGLGPAFNQAGEPYIAFRCLLQHTHDCRKKQKILCSTDWVQLALLAQEAELFHAVRHAHHNKESGFNADRRRYAVAGKEGLGRVCRSGSGVHRLRCAAAHLLNWFRFSLRQGLIDPVELEVERNLSEPELRSEVRDPLTPGVGTDRLNELLRYRDEHELDLPYGAPAEHLRRAYEEVA